MGQRLAGGNVAIALLANALATGAGLAVFILVFGPISGAHFNPAVTLADARRADCRGARSLPISRHRSRVHFRGSPLRTECSGSRCSRPRATRAQAEFLGEFVATFGLLAVVWGLARKRSTAIPFAVAAYIAAAYWFTSSTSFANPAVTLARAATDTFAGIRPSDAPAFIVAQLLGAAAATLLFRWLVPALPEIAPEVVVPQPAQRHES
jgi:glycerol uptake facilitator-like aquaporin